MPSLLADAKSAELARTLADLEAQAAELREKLAAAA
jgi:hypothetical protein